METFGISVRTLVEYVFSSGSIDARFQTSQTLLEGTRIHQSIQKTYNELDRKEVPVRMELVYQDVHFTLDGRCDGLLWEDGSVVVDEIKSTMRDLAEITENSYPVHWAQVKFYAYMYAKEQDLNEMTVQLTYVQVESGEQKRFRETMNFAALETFVYGVLDEYVPYAALRLKQRQERNDSMKSLAFPFQAYRQGQRQLAGAVYKTIAEKRNLFAKAPTGIGKTISTTFPAVKAIGEGLAERLFYLTAKTITRTTAEEAFARMEKQGLCMRSVTITAKDKVCFKEETRCQKEYCEFADGYYDRVNGAVLDILEHETLLTRGTIETYARKHKVCPFEFSIELAYAADAVICDYNYIFDPRISFKRLFEEQKKQTVLLIDEAHNLVDRAREMYSAEIQKSQYLQLQRSFKGVNVSIFESARAINQHLLAVRKRAEGELVEKQLDEELVGLLEDFVQHAEKEITAQENEELLDAYFKAQAFLRIAALYDERFVMYAETTGSEVRLKLFCLDPSHLLRQMGKNYRSKVYFSATLTPPSYYRDMLGAQEEDFSIGIPSPFRREQLQVLVQPVSTKYHEREKTKPHIVAALGRMTEVRGNYLVFFPSYQYMKDVYELYKSESPHIQTIMQDTGMREDEREYFLQLFQADNPETLVGFAVLGGIFSEGIDLKGDRLNGVAIIGVGLPQLGLERNIIKDYFNENGKNGYDYAYVFPGMNKVLQAGGRLIRSEEDTGTILLMDDRFLQMKYRQLLPEEWQHFQILQ
ncbi:ATP-dependent DNA helicase [Ectobacillus sp. JY-23]|uniref:ATP-dependent DNA helicase n=1 Tax=Ectobacillus sp. JY-23 TaxID=2933872 RepID=UPI001FF3F075|nr:ATP-dependent DNA helicase [Ectobacillus sp. JY-23]UOY91637.1 ATP-dependent DNA helicase [Ectobacillus sp. JY-23]